MADGNRKDIKQKTEQHLKLKLLLKCKYLGGKGFLAIILFLRAA